MKLKVKFINWSAGIPVAMINKSTAEKIGIHIRGRILLRTLSKYPKEMSASVNITGDFVRKNEIAVSSEIRDKMKLKKDQIIDINLSKLPDALPFIKKKLNNKRLSKKEIKEIVKEIVNNQLSEIEISLFISAMYQQGMSIKETIYLIKSILSYGNVLKLKDKIIADKHCIGGVPGNNTTPIIVSICAAAGLTMPKTSSKAITSAAGTADVINVISPISFSIPQLKKIIKKTKAFLVWGGALSIVPADSKIIGIEKELKIDPESQLLASIISKKLAMGAKYILIDIPYGKTAKVTKQQAYKLASKFNKIGKYFKKKLKVVLTNGEQPIGNGIGPVLELKDVLKTLNPKEESPPKDLEEKSLFLSGTLLEMTKKAKRGKGIQMAREILDSGKALKKFEDIIKAQGGKIKKLKLARFRQDILVKRDGKIKEINNKLTNSLARVAGCPVDYDSGVYLYKHKGDKVKKGEKLLTIYSESKYRLNEASRFYKKNKVITIK